MVAAGIINPVTGPRMAPCWRLEQLLGFARHTYRSIEEQLRIPFYRDLELVRIFCSEEERRLWMEKRTASGTNRFLGSMHPPGTLSASIRDPFGSFAPGGSGRLDVPALVTAVAGFLKKIRCLIQERFSYDDLEITARHVRWREWKADHVVFCEGFRGHSNPWFSHLPFNSAKGEVLTLEANDIDFHKRIINKKKWLLPCPDGSFRAGSTYDWATLDCESTLEGRNEILAALATFTRGTFKVTAQQAGVRPVMKDYRPGIGFHPRLNRLAIFNGFGSKGALTIPWFAAHFSKVLATGEDLDPEVDSRRFEYFRRPGGA